MRALFLLIFFSLPLWAQDEIPLSCQELLQLAERLDQLQREKVLKRPAPFSEAEQEQLHRQEFSELTGQFIEQIGDFGDERLQQWCEENQHNYQEIIDQRTTFGHIKERLLN